jgi:hypothetical protein
VSSEGGLGTSTIVDDHGWFSSYGRVKVLSLVLGVQSVVSLVPCLQGSFDMTLERSKVLIGHCMDREARDRIVYLCTTLDYTGAIPRPYVFSLGHPTLVVVRSHTAFLPKGP